MKINSLILSFTVIAVMLFSGCGKPQNGILQTETSISDAEKEDRRIATIDEGAEIVDMSYAGIDNTLIGWGLGRERDGEGRPVDAVSAQEKYQDHSALFIDMSKCKNIYLTFDEGYENGYTAQILDVLKEKEVKATFFVTYDYCRSSPELVKRMIEEGHTVGNHSYTHPSFPKCSEELINKEITTLHNYVRNNFGYEMTLFRFPKGEFSERTLKQVENLGYTSVFWSFAYQDWDMNKQPSANEAYEAVVKSTHDGEICLLHAVSKGNADALGRIIDYWRSQGYKVADINALTENDKENL